MSVRMVLTSTDSSEYFENKPNCFRVHLSKQIKFDGYWTVALTEFSTESWTTSNKTKSELFVCCDICEETIIGGKEAPSYDAYPLERNLKISLTHFLIIFQLKLANYSRSLYI